jgi:16S rRNA G1207 methylase RsmC
MIYPTSFVQLSNGLNSQKLPVILGAMKFTICALPSLPDWEQVSPSASLIAENVEINAADHVLLFGCYHGAVAAYLSRIVQPGHLTITDLNFTALEATRFTLSINNAPSVEILAEIELPTEYDEKFDVVIIQIPKGRLLARRWLVQAFDALALKGNLFSQ